MKRQTFCYTKVEDYCSFSNTQSYTGIGLVYSARSWDFIHPESHLSRSTCFFWPPKLKPDLGQLILATWVGFVSHEDFLKKNNGSEQMEIPEVELFKVCVCVWSLVSSTGSVYL